MPIEHMLSQGRYALGVAYILLLPFLPFACSAFY
jgi:hypothetical protein